MAREKSPLSPDIVYTLGKILYALTSTTITEDIVRTVCRQAGIAALGQAELSASLREFRSTIPTPKDKLLVLADIVPEGFLLSLVFAAQEFVHNQVTKVYQTDIQAKMTYQNTLAVVEKERSEALTAANTKAAECASLTMELESAQKRTAELTERNMALEKEVSLVSGRLMERDDGKHKKMTIKEKSTPKTAGRSAVKVSIAKIPAAAGNQTDAGAPDHEENRSAEGFEAVGPQLALVHEKKAP